MTDEQYFYLAALHWYLEILNAAIRRRIPLYAERQRIANEIRAFNETRLPA